MGCLLFPLIMLAGRGPRGRRFMRGCVRASYRLFVKAARMTGLFRVEMPPEDEQLLSSVHGRVVVANHISLIDVVILMAYLPDATAVAKAAAGRNPFYSRVVSSVFLVNDDPEAVLAASSECLAAGVNLVIFPEGTRTPSGTPRRLHRGAARISIASGTPLLCVSISCSPPVLAKGQPWWDVGDRTVSYSLKVCGEIVPPKVADVLPSRNAAIAVTKTIAERLCLV